MKKFIFALVVIAIIAAGAYALGDDFWSGIQKDFSGATSTIQKDMKNVTSQKQRGSGSPLSLQDEIDEVKALKAKELEPVNKQIAAKEAQMRKVLVDTKLSVSQKKAKTALLQKELNTLKTQKENIEEKYRQKIREFRY